MSNEKMRGQFEAWHESRRLKIIAESDRITAEKIADGWSDSVVTSAESTYEAIERITWNNSSFVPFQAGYQAALAQQASGECGIAFWLGCEPKNADGSCPDSPNKPTQVSQPYMWTIEGISCRAWGTKELAESEIRNSDLKAVPLFLAPPDYESLVAERDKLQNQIEIHESRDQWIHDNSNVCGGGNGFYVEFFVPADHEDIFCGIDAAIKGG